MTAVAPRRVRWPRRLQGRGAVLRALYALYYASGACWSPFFAVYLRQVGLSGLQVGTVAGIRPAVVLLSQPLWGLAADVRGRRRTLLFTMSLAALLLLGYIWPAGFWFFFAWTVLYALLSNPVGALIDSLVLDHLEERRSVSFGDVRLWGAVGWAAAALVIGRILAGRDLRLIFVFGAALMFVGLVVAWRGTRSAPGRVSLGGHWRGLGVVLHSRRLVAFLALVMFMQIGAASIFTFYGVYMSELGAPRPLIGMAYTLQGLSELPLYLAAAGIIRRLSPGKTLVVAFLVFAGRMLLYSSIRVPALAMAVEATHGLSWSLFLVASVGYVNRLVPREWRATGRD